MRILFLILLFGGNIFGGISHLFAQNNNKLISDSIISNQHSEELLWDMSFALKTMNVFRGILPSKTPVFSTQVGVKYKNLVLGAYGGSAFGSGSPNGEVYTETDLILMFYKSRFDIQAQWYYNFTKGVTHINKPSGLFDFNSETSIAIFDLIANLRLPNKFQFTTSTLLFGRDKIIVKEDIDSNIQLLRGEQRYSQYLSISQYKKWSSSKIEWHIGASFSWSNFNGQTLYADKPGFTDIGISYSRDLFPAKPINIPIKTSLYLNTVTNNIFLVATISIVQLSKLK